MTLMLIETKNHSAKTSRPEFIINPSNLVRRLVVNFIFYNLKYGNDGEMREWMAPFWCSPFKIMHE